MPEIKKYNTGETETELKEKYNYDGSELRKAQLRMVEMLAFLDKICKENNIVYFLSFGFVRYYNVLRDLESEYIKDEYQHNQRKYRGIQIDLFPYEYGAFEFGKTIVGKSYGFNEKYLLGKHAYMSGLVFHLTREGIIPALKLLSKLKGKKYVSLGYEAGEHGYRYLSTDVFPLKTIEFEGMMVPCPNHPEVVLSTDYGEKYMELPPIQNRDHHKVLNIRFLNEE